MTLSVSQDPNDQQVWASLELEHWPALPSLRGSVTSDGKLSLSKSFDLAYDWDDDFYTVHVGGWDMTLSGGHALAGRWTHEYSMIAPRRGTAFEEYEVVTLRRR